MVAWFSKQQSSNDTALSGVSEASLIIRTMKDDIDDIKQGRKGSFQTQVEESQRMKSSDIHPSARVSTSENPFSEENSVPMPSLSKVTSPVSPNATAGNAFVANKAIIQTKPSAQISGLEPTEGRGRIFDDKLMTKRSIWPIVSGCIVVLFLGGVFFVGWHFFFKKQIIPEETAILNPPLEIAEIPTPIVDNIPSIPLFALDKPNYLQVNIETVSATDIRALLLQTAERIKGANITEPVEFLITDQNNNPLAFSRFAFLLLIELDASLLALTQENFSVYVYNDEGYPRIGLSLFFKDIQTSAALITTTESSLPYAMRMLFFDQTLSIDKKIPFQSTTYQQFTVRFANIANSNQDSVDYTIRNNQMILGMSKNTLQAIIDTKIQ